MDFCLSTLARSIQDEIDRLPPVDPLTLSSPAEAGEEERVREVIGRVCASAPPEILSRMEDDFFRAGPLEILLKDNEITEIIVNGPASIWFEKKGHLTKHDDQFLSELNYRNFIARLGREAGIHASLDWPFGDGHWRGSRVHLALPPAAGRHAVISIRRHPRSTWTFDRLSENNWAPASAIETIHQLIRERANFLIVGGTGSGKTSVLAACLSTLPEAERVLLIEDVDELPIPNKISSKLLTRKDSNGVLRDIDQTELVRQALRMRPDRIVMGEIRGGEAKDLLMAFATGHSGCMGTLHADSARQALLRLEMLIQIGAPQWNIQTVRTLIRLSIHAVIVVTRTADGSRKLSGIHRVVSLEDSGFLLENLLTL